MEVLAFKKICKNYQNHKVLKDISFNIQANRITGLAGPNGAGKTTCMKIMAGILAPSEGEVVVFDTPLYPHPHKIKKKIGYLPESNPLSQEMRVREYLIFRGKLKDFSGKELISKMDEVISILELERVKNFQIKNLSTGFKQRVGLAAVFLGWPRLIILDEPVRGLDPIQIKAFNKTIKKALKRCTILISSHGLDELERIADNFIFLKEGKITHQGSLPATKSSLREMFFEDKKGENN